MYIPTQQERYRKVASLTLFLCVILPSGVVAWLVGVNDLLACAFAFLQPIALILKYLGFSANGALCLSALVQAIFFFALVRSRKASPKTRLTIAITWGMAFALLLRILQAYEVWRRAIEAAQAG